MAAKPLIGVNVDYRPARKDSSSFCYLHAGYCNSLVSSGAIPMLIPPMVAHEDLDRVLEILDGLVFIGGADLDCRRDGYMLHPSMRIMDHRREEFDRELMYRAAERKLPVMGIGCGMQLLNVSQGGSLSLHIKEDMPKAIPHLDAMDPNHRHALVIEMESIMERVYGEGEIRVNSMHHQAVDGLAAGFRVTARCPDGVVEAIESVTDWFAFGTQFHPEHESASALDLRLFEEFVVGITGEALETPEMRMVA
ncbi:MAG: gamma-glutamyl-gamma-aminobutyrate hydrolase family protein [Pirellulaceae bacterium]|nr:gamma-glutamyl-gamma-aminobutyrate hydrolase family protein [Pirellulaceae bacterium]